MKEIIITGADSGLGFATAKHLLVKDYAVIMACRNLSKANDAKLKLEQETNNQNIIIRQLDLASIQSIRDFVDTTNNAPYGLICNAGIQYSQPTQFTQDGFELTFGVNVLGHFLLTNLLLAKFNTLSRIAVVSSAVHDPRISGKRFGDPAFTSPELLAHPVDGSQTDWNKLGNTRYVTSKLCSLFFTYKLNTLLGRNNRRYTFVNAFNPGLMAGTGLGRNSPPITRFLWYHVLPFIAKTFKGSSTPEKSGLLLANLITSTDVSGKYFSLDTETASSPESYDENKEDIFWKGCEKLVSLKENEKWYKESN
jgi:NAD(P)-dependent dehydrogenase (short-subunit alcohol dehydrogenase family)